MNTFCFDIVCIGAGGAGITSALAASEKGAKVALLSKGPIAFGNTRVSGGNMTSVGFESDDSPDILFKDIYEAGEHLGEKTIIKALTDEAEFLPRIVENFGALLRRDSNGLLGKTVIYGRGGHSYNRTVVLPAKGIALGNALRMAVARSKISIFEEVIAYKLLWNGERVIGVAGYDMCNGETVIFAGKAVILATGGGGWLYYPHTSNTAEASGDGYSLALSVGAKLVNMEQIQFQAFGIARPSYAVGLVCGEPSHAGPQGRLLSQNGSVILDKFNRLTRGEVCKIMSLSIYKGLGTPSGGLLLDLSGNIHLNDGGKYLSMFNGSGGIMERVKFAFGEKAAKFEEPWEVCPTAHFFMGGIKTDEYGFTGIKGLFAAGETQGGLHGANRLGTVALTEILILGKRTGTMAAAAAEKEAFPFDKALKIIENNRPEVQITFNHKGKYRPITLIRKLQNLMWSYAGPVRDRQSLLSAIDQIEELKEKSKNLTGSSHKRFNTDIRDALELEKMLEAAEAVCRSALIREESRGAHVRVDFPKKWNKQYETAVLKKDLGLEVSLNLKDM